MIINSKQKEDLIFDILGLNKSDLTFSEREIIFYEMDLFSKHKDDLEKKYDIDLSPYDCNIRPMKEYGHYLPFGTEDSRENPQRFGETFMMINPLLEEIYVRTDLINEEIRKLNEIEDYDELFWGLSLFRLNNEFSLVHECCHTIFYTHIKNEDFSSQKYLRIKEELSEMLAPKELRQFFGFPESRYVLLHSWSREYEKEKYERILDKIKEFSTCEDMTPERETQNNNIIEGFTNVCAVKYLEDFYDSKIEECGDKLKFLKSIYSTLKKGLKTTEKNFEEVLRGKEAFIGIKEIYEKEGLESVIEKLNNPDYISLIYE